MHLVPRWADRNLSRLELISAWILILVMIGTFARYTLVVFAKVEKNMIERTVMNMDTALKYKAGIARMQSDHEIIRQLANQNPVEMIRSFNSEYPLDGDKIEPKQFLNRLPSMSAPSNYAGEIEGLKPESLEKGYWYYNKTDNTLIYVIRNSEFFSGSLEGIPRIKYRVTVEYTDRNGNGVYDPDIDEYRSISLAERGTYEWLN